MSDLNQPAPSLTAVQEFKRGWSVLVGALILYTVSIVAIPAYTNGIYIKYLTAEFDVGRGELGLVGFVTTAVMFVMAPTAGWLSDRFGMRGPIALSILGMAAVYALMGTVMHSFPVFILLTSLLTAVGAPSLPVVFTKAVNAWFDRARGLALGCVLIGTGITAIVGPPLVTKIVLAQGWQAGYLASAVVVLCALPVVVWLVRMPPWDSSRGPRMMGSESDTTLSQAVRGRIFWTMAAAFAIQASAALGLIHHLIPMMTDGGMSPVEAAGIATLSGLAITGGRFLVGAMVDHIFAPWLAAVIAAVFAGGCLLLAYGGLQFAPVSALAIGFALGAEVDFIGFMASRYYGLKHYGRIYGWLYAAFAIGAGISGWWVGELFDLSGSYHTALLTAAGLMVIVIALLVSLPRYASPHSPKQQGA